VFSSFEATKTMFQPSQPSQPFGHQKAILASLLPEAKPFPHFPDSMRMFTSS
jgi:hypothetical protein